MKKPMQNNVNDIIFSFTLFVTSFFSNTFALTHEGSNFMFQAKGQKVCMPKTSGCRNKGWLIPI